MILKPPLGSQLDLFHPINAGLVGYWAMNEGSGNLVNDLSLNSNHGTASGTTWDNGAISFDNAGDNISVPCDATGIDELTISCRIKREANTAQQYIADNSPGSLGWMLRTSTNTLYFYVYAGTTSIVATASIPASEWHTIAAIFYNQKAMIYIDGVLAGTSPTSSTGTTILKSTFPLKIGSTYDGTTSFDGDMDWFSVHERALSAQEIQSLYINPYQMFERKIIIPYGTLTPEEIADIYGIGYSSLILGVA